MRNFLVQGVLVILIILLSNTLSISSNCFRWGAGQFAYIIPKQESSVHNFYLPDAYINKDGSLNSILHLSITKGTETILIMEVQNKTIFLPSINWESGKYHIKIQIQNHTDDFFIEI